ncbi:MAG: PQQ-binding-like beta-propeller repeat protein, partial [Bryobacteraceae bacterium]
WWINIQTTGTSTVAISQDTVYAAAWFPFGEADQIVALPSFAELVKQTDKDADGKVTAAEFPADLAAVRRPDAPSVPGASIFLKPYFKMLDQNGDGVLQENEWDMMRGMMSKMRADHGLVAFKPGEGDLTANVIWKEKSAIPEVPSPLAYDKRVYMVRNGGIVSCVDGESGKLVYRARLGAGGPYYSSPIAGGGRIFAASGEGTVVVFAAGDKLEVLARNELKEDIYATPAAAGNVLYVRTARRLYAFGNK